jgi:hypothetical protein
MRLIYRCAHCAAQRELTAPAKFRSPIETLSHAYNMTDLERLVLPFDLHPCADGTVGVAQLVAVCT